LTCISPVYRTHNKFLLSIILITLKLASAAAYFIVFCMRCHTRVMASNNFFVFLFEAKKLNMLFNLVVFDKKIKCENPFSILIFFIIRDEPQDRKVVATTLTSAPSQR